MSNQLHGKTFEDMIKACYPGSSDGGRTNTAAIDIESKFDAILHLPTIIKTTKSNVVGLSDAQRFWNINRPYRLLVGQYTQCGNSKKFNIIYEFMVSIPDHQKLISNISIDVVISLSKQIKTYRIGEHAIAQREMHDLISPLNEHSLITLNPKIDSKSQRRLQCSTTISRLISAGIIPTVYKEGECYRTLVVGFSIKSPTRVFNPKPHHSNENVDKNTTQSCICVF